MDVISNLHIWNGGSPIHLAPEIEVKSRIALPFGFVIPQAVKISAKAYAITTPIRIGMILNIPFPQILKMMITANATKAISQLVDAFWIADGARDKPMQMMIGPVTTGGRKRITRFTPTSLKINATTRYSRPATTIPPHAYATLSLALIVAYIPCFKLATV